MRLPAPCVCRTDSGAAAGDLALLILLDFLSPSKTHRQIQSGAWLRDCPRPFNGAHHMCNLERPLRRRGPTAISPVGKDGCLMVERARDSGIPTEASTNVIWGADASSLTFCRLPVTQKMVSIAESNPVTLRLLLLS
jgi:hypothetical protein